MPNDNPQELKKIVLVQNGAFNTGEPGHFKNSVKVSVLFEKPYKNTPSIQFGLSKYDANNTAVRVAVEITDSNTNEFVAEIKTWSNSSIYYAEYNWIAIGEPA